MARPILWDANEVAYVQYAARLSWLLQSTARLLHQVERLTESLPDAIGSAATVSSGGIQSDGHTYHMRLRAAEQRLEVIAREIQELRVEAHFARKRRKQGAA